MKSAWLVGAAVVFAITILVGLAPSLPEGEVTVHVPRGATLREIVDTLNSRQVIERPLLFLSYARFKGSDRSLKAGTYRLPRRARFSKVLQTLTEGRAVTYPVMIPEGARIQHIADRISAATDRDSAAVAQELNNDTLPMAWNVPGPGLEGYLFPDTYHFAEGVPIAQVVSTMIQRYHRYWTAERRERLAAIGLSEREAVTLASIIQAEARRVDEMPTISSVYHNRLRAGMRLQSDPTVLYALGGHRPRLLHAAMDSVADHPYNTYTRLGLPPGPICAPGAAALDAAIQPAITDYFYFVARPNGEHIFSRSLREHNNARIRSRRESASGRGPTRPANGQHPLW